MPLVPEASQLGRRCRVIVPDNIGASPVGLETSRLPEAFRYRKVGDIPPSRTKEHDGLNDCVVLGGRPCGQCRIARIWRGTTLPP